MSLTKRHFLRLLAPLLVLGPRTVVRAEVYLSADQAKSILFPGQTLTEKPVLLSPEQMKAIAKASGVRVRSAEVKAWRSSDGGWFFLDNVVGKHEFIDIAVGLTASGAVKGVEILVYRETYGGQVRNPNWRAQFRGKTTAAPLKVDTDIKNISGATLSSVHVAEGVRRLLHTHAIALNR